jgi:hypothetical protein
MCNIMMLVGQDALTDGKAAEVCRYYEVYSGPRNPLRLLERDKYTGQGQ